MSIETLYFVYVLASAKHGTLYVGMTNDLMRRMFEHREGVIEGFTKKYGITILVYFETFPDPASALHREKRIKKYKRSWKINLIEEANPDWIDLHPSLTA